MATAEYDPVNRVLTTRPWFGLSDDRRLAAGAYKGGPMSFASGSLVGTAGNGGRHSARIKDLVGNDSAFELRCPRKELYRFYVVGQTGYDRNVLA